MANRFTEAAPGELLLFSNDRNKALRLEVGYLKLEFTDSMYIGADPPGTLYYDSIDELRASGTHSYTVKGEQRNNKTWIIVNFFKDGRNYAVFEAADKRDALARSGMDGYSHSGRWTTLDRAYDNGSSFQKARNDSTAKLLLPGLNRRARWQVQDSQLIAQEVKIDGIASFKSNFDTSKVKWAGSTEDHLAFFESNVTSTELLAWFLPMIYEPNIPGPIKNYSGVTWEKIDPSKP